MLCSPRERTTGRIWRIEEINIIHSFPKFRFTHRKLSIATSRDPRQISPWQTCWLEIIVDLNFIIVSVSGNSNEVADYLSRELQNPRLSKRDTNPFLVKCYLEPQRTTCLWSIYALFNHSNTAGVPWEGQISNLPWKIQERLEFRDIIILRNGKICALEGNFHLKLLHNFHLTLSTGYMTIIETKT